MTIINNGITNSIVLLTQESLSDRMRLAALNTVLGMGIVFAVLILMIMLISLFKYLPGPNNKEVPKAEISPVVNTVEQNINLEDTNLLKDHELIAVITAAISKYNSENLTNDSASGFVVRSIRKINK